MRDFMSKLVRISRRIARNARDGRPLQTRGRARMTCSEYSSMIPSNVKKSVSLRLGVSEMTLPPITRISFPGPECHVITRPYSRNFNALAQHDHEKDSCESQISVGLILNELRADSKNSAAKETVEFCAKPSVCMEESVEALEIMLKELDASASPGDPRIGAMCLKLAQLCVSVDEDADKILMYGQRALNILGSKEISIEFATCLETIGSAYHKKGEFDKAVTQLERASMILEKLSADDKENGLGTLKHAVKALLGQVNMELGREEEALLNFQEAIAINERILEPHDPNLGKSYQQTAEVYMQARDFEEALNLCLKALPIYIDNYGSSSLQVAELRKALSIIYYELDDFEKVLEEHHAIRPILQSHGKLTDVASIDLASGETLLCLDRYMDAIRKLNEAVKQTSTESLLHGQALVLLSKAHAALKEEKCAIRYCKKALDSLKNGTMSLVAGASFVELASVLQSLQNNEQALMVLKIALEIYQKHPMEQAAVAHIESQIGRIYLLMERATEALPYLERSSAKIENLHGAESPELLDVYNHLGITYMHLKRPDDALAKFEAARVISTLSEVADNEITVTLYNNMACLYDNLHRVGDALMCQKMLIDSIKKTGIETIVSLKAAEQKLQSLVQKAKTLGTGDIQKET